MELTTADLFLIPLDQLQLVRDAFLFGKLDSVSGLGRHLAASLRYCVPSETVRP